MTNRRERRELSRRNQKWLAAVRKSDLPPEAIRVAEALAQHARDDGVIVDSEIAIVLRDIDDGGCRHE